MLVLDTSLLVQQHLPGLGRQPRLWQPATCTLVQVYMTTEVREGVIATICKKPRVQQQIVQW